MKDAPGTLSDQDQTRLMAQVLSLIRGAFGDHAQCALAVFKVVENKEGGAGLSIYTMGSTADPQGLKAGFELAAHSMEGAKLRALAIEEGEPGKPKN